MTCHRAYEIDLEDLLLEPGSPALLEFEEHASGCEDCAQALSLERALGAHLRGDVPGGHEWHPSDTELLGYRADPGAMAADLQSRIQTHFSACAPCRDAFHAFTALAHSPVAEAAPSLLARLADAARPLLRQPAFASGLAAALLAVFGLFLVLGGPEQPAPGEWTRGRPPRQLAPIVDPDPGTQRYGLRLIEDAPGVLSAGSLPAGALLELELLVSATAASQDTLWVQASPVSGEGRPLEGPAHVVAGERPHARLQVAAEWLAPGTYEISLYQGDATAPPIHQYTLEVR